MPLTYRLVRFQALIGILIVLVMSLFSTEDAIAAAAGSAAVWIPNALLAWKLQRESNPRRLVGYGIVRLVLTILCLTAVLALMELPPAGFFAGFVGQYIGQVYGSWSLPRHRKSE